jgi:hypothetical protein
VGGQHHAPAALPPGKTRYPLYRRLGGPQGRSGRVLPDPSIYHVVTDRASQYISTVTDRASQYISTVIDRASQYISTVTDRASQYISTVTDRASQYISTVIDRA